MPFYPGEKVLIIKEYSNLMDGTHAGNSEMFETYAGTIMTIFEVYNKTSYYPFYSMVEDSGRWDWFSEMLIRADSRTKLGEIKTNNLPDI